MLFKVELDATDYSLMIQIVEVSVTLLWHCVDCSVDMEMWTVNYNHLLSVA